MDIVLQLKQRPEPVTSGAGNKRKAGRCDTDSQHAIGCLSAPEEEGDD